MRKIYISVLSFVFVLFFSTSFAQKNPTGDIWLHMLTTGTPVDTKYLGDQLNTTGTWYIQFEVGQAEWNQTDAGIGYDYTNDATWTWRTANWYANGSGSNKQVQADFGNFRFTQAGYWYIAGRAKGESTDPFHYANSFEWEQTEVLTPLSYFQVDAINPIGPSPQAMQNEANPTSQIDLSWTKNDQNHNVMIVRKKVYQSWTEPSQGTAYTAGNTIGSGVVVYNSTGTSFTNTGLASSTDYDYKFYSVNNNYYSDGEIYPIVASTYTAFASGDGTAGNPFQVANADALNCVRNYVNSVFFPVANFIQTANIDLINFSTGAGWIPISDLKDTYNGQGHTISNLKINNAALGYAGLFEKISTGNIKNLGLIGVDIKSGSIAGAFAGEVSPINVSTGIKVENCYATGSVEIVSGGTGAFYVGGLVGNLSADMSKCYSTCNVTVNYSASHQYVGGLVGYFSGATLENSYYMGTIDCNSSSYYQAIGGIAGHTIGTINNCFSVSPITYIPVDVYNWIGGLAGHLYIDGEATYSFYDYEVAALVNPAQLEGKSTTAEMKTVGTYLANGWDFSPSGVWAINGTTNSGYPYLRFQGAAPANIWNGGISTDWNEPENWNDIAVPTSDKTVIIPDVTTYPVIGTAAVVTNLTIETGSLLTVSSIGSLTVSSTLVNKQGVNGLVVQADATDFGSLIENNGVSATVQSFISENKWHFISSPVSGLTSSLFDTRYMQQHTETGGFVDVPELDLPLTKARGFALWGGTTGGFPVSYSGPLNTGTIPVIVVTRAAAGVARGWNLIGNPYASVLDWDLVGKTNVNTAIYIENAGGWAIYNNGVGTPVSVTGKIAPGQGFFVQVTDGQNAGTVSIANNDRVHNTSTFYKSSEVSNLIRLQVSGNSYSDEAVVRFASDATPEFDGNYDAHKFFAEVDGNVQIYTLGSTPLAINALQPETSSVPLGIRANVAGTYTLAATEINDMPYATLEDTKTGIFTELAKGPYTFNFTSGEEELRFKLHFSALSVNEDEASGISIYSYHKTAYINLKNQLKGDIYIYNMAGQLITSRETATGLVSLGINAPGIYIVKVVSDKETTTAKIFIQ